MISLMTVQRAVLRQIVHSLVLRTPQMHLHQETLPDQAVPHLRCRPPRRAVPHLECRSPRRAVLRLEYRPHQGIFRLR